MTYDGLRDAHDLAVQAIETAVGTGNSAEREMSLRVGQIWATLAIAEALDTLHTALRDQTAAIDEIETRLATWSQQ